MAFLEKHGLITQPHTSAGRIPTTEGYRMYVDQLADYEQAKKLAIHNIKKLSEEFHLDKTREKNPCNVS